MMQQRLQGSLVRLVSPLGPRLWLPADRCQRGQRHIVMNSGDAGGSSSSTGSKPLREHHELLGDLGARDPFQAEIESDFGDKVLGYADTEHLITPPDAIGKVLGLSSRKCVPCEGGNVEALDDANIDRLRNQVPGWQVVEVEGKKRIRQEWAVKNFVAGIELFKRIAEVAEEQGHHPDLHLEGYNKVHVELWTHAVGGLTENDFIIAAHINKLDISDLKKKQKVKYWA